MRFTWMQLHVHMSLLPDEIREGIVSWMIKCHERGLSQKCIGEWIGISAGEAGYWMRKRKRDR